MRLIRPGRRQTALPGPRMMATLNDRPEITVLITAYNEAENIAGCLRALDEQDYPMERVEIVLVDDRSTDGTADRARALRLTSLRVLRVDQAPERLTARQGALDLGLREARGDVVLLCDANGRVPREWIREMTGHLSFRDGAVTGPVIYAGHRGLQGRMETLHSLIWFNLQSWAYRHGLGASLYGANLALRRDAYLETGGYETIGFAPAEDAALGAALRRAGWSLRYMTAPAVQDGASPTLLRFMARLRRHIHHCAPLMTALIVFVLLSNVALLGAAAWLGPLWFWLLLARYGVGCLMTGLGLARYGSLNLFHWIWLYEPVMTVLLLAAYLENAIQPRWRMGGLIYHRHGPAGAA
jgi:cellulose synthase/poly-beta-1,6-N-acetylglucosamine synthase-like glycosyltransferase